MTYKPSFLSTIGQTLFLFLGTIGIVGLIYGLSGIEMQPTILLILIIIVGIIAITVNYIVIANQITITEEEVTIKKITGKEFTYPFSEYYVESKLTDHYLNGAKYATTLRVLIHDLSTGNIQKGFSLRAQSKKNVHEIVNALYRFQKQEHMSVDEENGASTKQLQETATILFSTEEIEAEIKKIYRGIFIALLVIEIIIVVIITTVFFGLGDKLTDEIMWDLILYGGGALLLFGFIILAITIKRARFRKQLTNQMPTKLEFTDTSFSCIVTGTEKTFVWDNVIKIIATNPNNREVGVRKLEIQYPQQHITLLIGSMERDQFLERYEQILDICEIKLLDQGKFMYDVLN